MRVEKINKDGWQNQGAGNNNKDPQINSWYYERTPWQEKHTDVPTPIYDPLHWGYHMANARSGMCNKRGLNKENRIMK